MAPANRAPRKDDFRGLREEPSVVSPGAPKKKHTGGQKHLFEFASKVLSLWLYMIVFFAISGALSGTSYYIFTSLFDITSGR